MLFYFINLNTFYLKFEKLYILINGYLSKGISPGHNEIIQYTLNNSFYNSIQ